MFQSGNSFCIQIIWCVNCERKRAKHFESAIVLALNIIQVFFYIRLEEALPKVSPTDAVYSQLYRTPNLFKYFTCNIWVTIRKLNRLYCIFSILQVQATLSKYNCKLLLSRACHPLSNNTCQCFGQKFFLCLIFFKVLVIFCFFSSSSFLKTFFSSSSSIISAVNYSSSHYFLTICTHHKFSISFQSILVASCLALYAVRMLIVRYCLLTRCICCCCAPANWLINLTSFAGSENLVVCTHAFCINSHLLSEIFSCANCCGKFLAQTLTYTHAHMHRQIHCRIHSIEHCSAASCPFIVVVHTSGAQLHCKPI